MNIDISQIKAKRYGKYSPDRQEKNRYKSVELFELAIFYRFNHLLEFLNELDPKIHQRFISQHTSTIRSMVETNYVQEKAIDLPKILEKFEHLQNYPDLAELVFNLTIKLYNLPPETNWEGEEIEILAKNFYRGLLFQAYYQLLTLTELMNRKEAIDLFIKHGEVYVLTHPRVSKIDALEEFWKSTTDLADGDEEVRIISEIINGKFIIRRETCLWSEILKEAEDSELAYFVCCYGDYVSCKARNEHFVLTRNHSLLQGYAYCDKVFHDIRIDPDISHPSKEFFDKYGQKYNKLV
ncbi:MAG: L-2-amino-thiazoline-4-carboxylic acid hydrolase [Candidatus Hermodarchaeota archaeon]